MISFLRSIARPAFVSAFILATFAIAGHADSTFVSVSDPNVVRGHSPLNWKITPTFLSTSVGNPSLAVVFTGIVVDVGGATVGAVLPPKFWVNIGNSIESGDAAAYAAG